MDTQTLVNQLLTAIGDGTWLPEQKCPSERKLAEQHGCARSVAREALVALESMGFITRSAARAGRFANLLQQGTESKAVPSLTSEKAETLKSLLTARRLLESQAAFYAATRGNEDDRLKLTEVYLAMTEPKTRQTPLRRAKADLAFHMHIAHMSHNLFVVSFSQTFYTRYFNAIYEVLSQYLSREGRFPDGIAAQHYELYQAILQGDGERAQGIAAAHISHTEAIFARLIRAT